MGSGASKRRHVKPHPVQNGLHAVRQRVKVSGGRSTGTSTCSDDSEREYKVADMYDTFTNANLPVASKAGNNLRKRIQNILRSPFSEASPATSGEGTTFQEPEFGFAQIQGNKDYVHHVGGYTLSEVDMESGSEGKIGTRVNGILQKRHLQ